MTTYEGALAALADPTRRELLDRLRKGPASVTELTKAAAVSQPAVSQHLRVLEEARLVTVQPQGTRRIYRLTREGLEDVRNYIDAFWQEALEAFEAKAKQQTGGSTDTAARRRDG